MKLLGSTLPHLHSKRRGSALVVAMIGCGAMLALSLAFLRVSAQAGRGAQESFDRVRTLQLAEAGLTEAVTALRAQASGTLGSELNPIRLGDGLFWTKATEIEDDVFRLDVVAMSGSGRIALAATAKRDGKGGIGQALFTTKKLDLHHDFMSDSFDSDKGSYASQVKNEYDGPGKKNKNDRQYAGSNGHVASNGRVRIKDKVAVFGNVIHGAGADFVNKHKEKGYVSGKVLSGPPLELPSVDVPDDMPSQGKVHLHGRGTGYDLVLGPGEIRYRDFTMHKKASVLIVGPATMVVDHKLKIDSPLTIDDSNGPVLLYAREKVDLKKKSLVTIKSGKSDSLILMVGDRTDKKGKLKKQKLKIAGEFHGVIYAPHAHIDMKKSANIFGAVLAYSVHAHDTAIHFDERLMRVGTVGGGDVKLTSWRLVPVEAKFLRTRRDPFALLGVNREDLLTATEAWSGRLPEPEQGAGLPWEEDDYPWLDPNSVEWPLDGDDSDDEDA